MATATLYWLHLPNETNIFTDGYVGVTPSTASGGGFQ
jgi:hypothetical protein